MLYGGDAVSVVEAAGKALVRNAAKIALAGAFAAGGFAVGASDAEAMADSDGYVPVYYSCWSGGSVGVYEWYYDGYSVTGSVSVNSCLLDSLGAGPNDYQRVIDHEMGHAYGYGHSGDPYSTMYPATTIYGSRRRYVSVRRFSRPAV
ncbi:hypothetical protein [Rubrobacter indicoceani]|uniref:hypothetical protein n=1 Tax=Rubrobacter indicoceani TaxID=2051957 RepID=UPI000E5B7AD1|nr:hypothetical protein [Rubrobacter indicoceani]